MLKTVGLLYSDYVLVEYINSLLKKEFKSVRFLSLVDDYLLQIIGDKKAVYRRVLQYCKNMEEAKVDLIINTCTSLSPYVPQLREKTNIKIVSLEDLLIECIQTYKKIGVIATIETALNSVKTVVLAGDKEFVGEICQGAFQMLKDKKETEHDKVIISKIHQLENEVDAIILAQASMNRVISEYSNKYSVPVFGLVSCLIDKLKEWEKND